MTGPSKPAKANMLFSTFKTLLINAQKLQLDVTKIWLPSSLLFSLGSRILIPDAFKVGAPDKVGPSVGALPVRRASPHAPSGCSYDDSDPIERLHISSEALYERSVLVAAGGRRCFLDGSSR